MVLIKTTWKIPAMSRLRCRAKLQPMPHHQWHFVQPMQHHHLRGERWEQKLPGQFYNIPQLKPAIDKEGALRSEIFHVFFPPLLSQSVSDEACTNKCSSNPNMINWAWTRAITCCMVAVVPPAFPKCKGNAQHVSSCHVL